MDVPLTSPDLCVLLTATMKDNGGKRMTGNKDKQKARRDKKGGK